MFSKKINKKIAESSRRDTEHLQLTHQQIGKLDHRYHHHHPEQKQPQQQPSSQIAASINYSQLQDGYDEDPSEIFSSPPQQRSRSRIAAGFISFINPDNNSRQPQQVGYSNRSSRVRSPKLRGGGELLDEYVDDDEEVDAGEEEAHHSDRRIVDDNNVQLQRSTDEIVEEFDVDNVELRYPIQDYPSGENLIDYSESSSLRKSSSSSQQQQRESGTKAIFSSSSSTKSRRSTEKLAKKGRESREDLQDAVENDGGGGSRYFDTTNFSISDNQYEPSYMSRSKGRNSSGGSQSSGRSTNQQQRASRRPSGNALERQPSTTLLENQSSIEGSLNSSMVNMGQFGTNSNANFQLTPNRSLSSNNSSFNTFVPSASLVDGQQRQGSAGGIGMNLNAAPRDVVPLPIEIPESVTDADAFRRYLSVRRGASPYLSNNESNENDDDEEEAAERSTLESLGRSSNRLSTGGSSEILASTTSARLTNPFPSPVMAIGSSSSGQKQNLTQPGGGDGPRTGGGGGLKNSLCPQQQRQESPECSLATQYLKKTSSLSHAIMTLALLSASAAQLRFVVAYSHVHAYPTLNYFLICSCIIIEILVGIGFVVLARFDFQDSFVEQMHSYLIFGLFVVTVANVIVAAFALDDHICDSVAKKLQQPPPPMTLDRQPLQFDPNQNL